MYLFVIGRVFLSGRLTAEFYVNLGELLGKLQLGVVDPMWFICDSALSDFSHIF